MQRFPHPVVITALLSVSMVTLAIAPVFAQQVRESGASGSGDRDGSVAVPHHYVLGPDDVIAVEYWRDKDLSAEVVIRPDGKISLPLLNDVAAAGLTPQQLRDVLMVEARRFVEDPIVRVVVKEIKSRKVFITGEVEKPGVYPLNQPTTVVQLIAIAGGLREFADAKRIFIVRSEGGRQTTRAFNYSEVLKGQNLSQNIELAPGDTVMVP
jgi:polysaccharide export outer membrane protein